MVQGQATDDEHDALKTAERTLLETFSAAPDRPTGLATADQAMANVVQALEWSDHAGGPSSAARAATCAQAAAADRDLLEVTADLLDATADLLAGAGRDGRGRGVGGSPTSGGWRRPGPPAPPTSGRSPATRTRCGPPRARRSTPRPSRSPCAARPRDALIASGRADPDTIAAERRAWYGQPETGAPRPESRRAALVGQPVRWSCATPACARCGSANALAGLGGAGRGGGRGRPDRGAARLLGGAGHAVGAADQRRRHRGRRRWRALAGTVVGFALGAALLLVIGTDPTALWIAMPIAVLVAAYAPGTAPFLVGQAAFTITVVVLFNLLAPAGWTIGLLRVAGRGHRLCGQPGGRGAVLAPGRGHRGRRRPGRLRSGVGSAVPAAGGGLGARRADRGAGHRARPR